MNPMQRFQNFPIQRKILLMTLLICGAVFLVAITSFVAFQVVNFRTNFERDTSTLAEIIANNSTAAMSFQDEAAAAEIVNSLRAKPTVVCASLVLPNGSLFVSYASNARQEALTEFPPPGKFLYVGGQLLFTQPVILKNDRIGTLCLQLDYERTFQELIRFYAKIVGGVTVVSIGLAVVLSGLLGRTIARPVLQLAQTAKIIGEKKDYSMRAAVNSRRDEVGQLAASFNEMLGRIEAQDAALSLSQQKMEALVHSIDGIVWERTPDTFRFTFISRQSETILGYAPQAWLDQPDFWESKLHPQDAAKAVQTGHEKATRGEPYNFEYRMIAADGKTVWIRESGTVLVEKGRPVAMRGIFHNVTREKLDAAELDKLNRQLIDTSRNAGMADVATGVLHNVGNVLNSVIVSTTLMRDRLRQSKIANLSRATAMFRGQNGRLAEFLTSDPKGKLLPEYLDTVAGQLNTEQAELITEMDSVGQHIEHIKEIVAMQQNYAKVSGAYENVSPVELVEDALRLNVAALERHRIELVREFAPDLPKVCVDRHKFLQVFINLLRNAKHAMEDEDEPDRRMIIRMSASPDRVKIVVRDNGIGIPRENLTKIFNHGFTTKKDGHGFGLHSGANAAKEMGGSLTGHSDGPGLGAEFTLELPTSAAKQKQEPLKTEHTA
jgi:PAS domain S-box-containing protein